MKPLVYGDVLVYGGVDPDEEPYRKCRITMLGKPADAVLYSLDVDGSRWRVVDRLTAASVTEAPDGTMEIVGTSNELVDVVGVAPADAQVRWHVTPRGCRNCG